MRALIKLAGVTLGKRSLLGRGQSAIGVSFGGDVKPSVPGDLVKIGFCLLQALISHYCGKPLRGNKNKTIIYTWSVTLRVMV